ncbi:MAG TPA: hypothetical protein VGW99_05230 [Chthoniobacterales bacterium]|nr:hypothetical protein [Chthoniobacterales bacterium]
MKRFVLLLIVAAAAAFAISYELRQAATTSPTAVAALLPRGTILFVHLPDFNRARDEWHDSDIYKLYREPVVLAFLQRPLAKLPQHDAASEILHEVERLAPKNAFIGLTSIENNSPKIVAGFRFRGSQENAEKIIGKWRAQSLNNTSTAPRETVEYMQHKIDIVGTGPNQSATVYDGGWFFASNDLDQLKALLDRADHRTLARASPSRGRQDRESTLEAEENFRAAIAHMPSSYALLFYVQPKTVAEKLGLLQAQIGQQLPADQRTILEQMRSICGATYFDRGKIHDVFFVGMARRTENASLARASVSLGTKDTFFYLATLLNIERLAGVNQPDVSAPFPAWLHKVFDAASRNGVLAEDWKAAFELELGSLADWPPDARWPSLIVTLPVKDVTRADKVVSALTSAIDEDLIWTKTQKDGVHYFFVRWGLGNLIAATPTIAFSNKTLVAGLDPTWVEAAMTRTQRSSSELASSASYKSAARALPAPTNFFAYVDMPLFYSRLDAALRPLLLMSAAFMPAISDHIDISKLPAPEVVTKHLSPIVSSQRYERDGYISESIGPITLSQAVIILGVPAIVWLGGYHSGG